MRAKTSWPPLFGLSVLGAVLVVSAAAGSGGGVISTFAGSGKNFGATGGYGGDGGPAARAHLRAPAAVAVDVQRDVFIADHLNNVIRKVALTGTITTVAHADSPWGVAADTRGNIYYEDGPGVFKASPDGTVTPFAGTNPTSYDLGDGGPAASAYLSHPVGLATDRRGNVYIADSAHNRIRRVGSDGTITTVAGTGSPGFSGDGGPATKARLKAPWVVTVDAGGNLYIGDSGNRRVRKVTPGGTISTIAGSGASRDSPDGTRALKASFYNVFGLAVDRSGTVYIADGIARVYALRAGRVSTFAGDASGDKGGFGGDGGVARRALLDHPQGLAVDAHSDLYIADLYNNRVRKVTGPK